MGGQPDTNVASVCQREGRTVVTLDLDFADIRTYPPGDYAGIIVLRLARLEKHHVLSVVQRLLVVLEHEPLLGKLWIVGEASVRVRG
jgi:predicted nuclease of predicted toxin-antitoxin system